MFEERGLWCDLPSWSGERHGMRRWGFAGRSPIPGRVLGALPSALPAEPGCQWPAIADLFDRIGAITDPRDRRGRRHEIGCVLAVALCALLCGAASLRAIGQWSANASQHTLARRDCRARPGLGIRAAPSTSTLRRVLAVDGKALRGAAGPEQAPAHLLAVMAPGRRIAAPVAVGQPTRR